MNAPTEVKAEAEGEWLPIEGDLRAWYARPAAAGPHPVVLCLIEAYGVNAHFKRLAARFAAEGFCAAVPDIFHGKVFSYDDSDGAMNMVRSLNEEQAMADIAATLDVLDARAECDTTRTTVAGFCMGGRLAFRANGELGKRIDAAACFYGGGIAPEKDHFGRKPLLDLVPRMHGAVMLFYGVNDRSIHPDEHARIVEALSTAKLRYGLHVFPGAGHAFFSEDRSSYNAAAAAESWPLMLEFFRTQNGAAL